MKKSTHKGLGKIAAALGVAGAVAAVGAAAYALSDKNRREKAMAMLDDAKNQGEKFLKSIGDVVETIREEAPEKVEELQKKFTEVKKALMK